MQLFCSISDVIALSEGMLFHCVSLRPTRSAHPDGKLILMCFLDCKAKNQDLIYSVILPFDRCIQISVYNDTGKNMLICSVYLTKLAPILAVMRLPFDLKSGIPLTRCYRRSDCIAISKCERIKQRWYRSGNFEICCRIVRLPTQLLSFQRLLRT